MRGSALVTGRPEIRFDLVDQRPHRLSNWSRSTLASCGRSPFERLACSSPVQLKETLRDLLMVIEPEPTVMSVPLDGVAAGVMSAAVIDGTTG
jgi:hypothetical protein